MNEMQELYKRIFKDYPSDDMTIEDVMDSIVFAVEGTQDAARIKKDDILYWLGFQSDGVLSAATYDMKLRERISAAVTLALAPVLCPSCDGIGKDETGEGICTICDGYGVRYDNDEIVWNADIDTAQDLL